MATNLGMRGSGNWATDQRPKNWRETILYRYPNGDFPLTAMLSMLSSESTDDPEFNWWTKTLPAQGGAVTNVYTDSGLSVAYVSGGTAGTTLYVKMAEAVADEIRAGHQVLLRDASNLDVDVNAKVTAVVKNGASSYCACKLLEADDNSASNDLSDCDTILVIGNINAEGAVMPTALAYDPVKWYNYTQIFRTSLSITRTAKKQRLRTGNGYQEAKREALELHGIEIEKAYLFGIGSENTGSNGKPERTTQGLIPAIKAGGTSANYVTDSNYSSQSWLQGGEQWLDTQLEIIFRYGRDEKLAFAGSGTLLAINRLAKSSGQIQLQPETIAYGMKVMRWITPFGDLLVKRHPLFSNDSLTRYAMAIFEPQDLKERYIDNTTFYKEGEKQNTGAGRTDSTDEEWLTEVGLEYHHPNGWGWLTGFNSTNTA